MAADTFDKAKRAAAVEAVHRAMANLQECWDCVAISVSATDSSGNMATYELEHDVDGEDDED